MNALDSAPRAGIADLARLEPGFAEPVHDAQATFRCILDAMAFPGQIKRLPAGLAARPAPLGPAAAAIALTLCDIDTPFWLDNKLAPAAAYLAFHCGTPPARTPVEARFAFVGDAAALPHLDTFGLGTDEYPERSTTLVIEIGGLVAGTGVQLSGPGIRSQVRLGAVGLPARFWAERAALRGLFPRGLDVIFVNGMQLAALPRSTRVAL